MKLTMDHDFTRPDELRIELTPGEVNQLALGQSIVGMAGGQPWVRQVRVAIAPARPLPRCADCDVELTGAHYHAKDCPQNWPNVKPSEWTVEQRARAVEGTGR